MKGKHIFLEKVSNEIFDKIRNFTKYFRGANYCLPKAILSGQKKACIKTLG